MKAQPLAVDLRALHIAEQTEVFTAYVRSKAGKITLCAMPRKWRDVEETAAKMSKVPDVERVSGHTEIIQARRLSEAAFNDLREREEGKRFVSFVTVPDLVSEANGAQLRKIGSRSERALLIYA